jgi:hypothetical protein
MAGMQRILQAELLDSLPPDDPAALHNRRDLRVINRCMGNYRWFARTLPALLRGGEAALELGAGDGTLGLELARRGIPVDGLDLWPRPPAWPARRAWHRTDLRTFDGYARYPVVAGNLIFHQFNAEELAELGRVLRRQARTIVACEPARRRLSQVLLAVLGPLLGANAVTRHDARVSVAAGFRADELPRALGLDPGNWQISCGETALGAYRMVALRRA